MRTGLVNKTRHNHLPDGTSGAANARRTAAVVTSLLATVGIALLGIGTAGASLSGPQGAASARYQGGAQVSDGIRTVTVSQSSELQPGQSVVVNGAGFDINKGVYVGLCVVPPAGAAPSPCAGGEDRTGNSGASAWFSSNPPAYARGIPDPYGQGGTFSTQIQVSSGLGGGLDCRQVQCAIATRNDHTRSTDRSQDLFIPVTFAAEAPQQTQAPQPTQAPVTQPAPVEEPVQATIAEAPATPAPPTEAPATTARPKQTTTAKPKRSTTTRPPKSTTTKPTTTTTAKVTTTARARSEEATITVSPGDGGSGGGWGWALAAAGGAAVLGAAGVGVFRVRAGHWPGVSAPSEAATAP